jgi:hypothetical protein
VRYYIMWQPKAPHLPECIIAEVAADPADDGFDPAGTAKEMAQVCQSRVASRDLLESSEDGRRTLATWEARDDSVFQTDVGLAFAASRVVDAEIERRREEGRPPT